MNRLITIVAMAGLFYSATVSAEEYSMAPADDSCKSGIIVGGAIGATATGLFMSSAFWVTTSTGVGVAVAPVIATTTPKTVLAGTVAGAAAGCYVQIKGRELYRRGIVQMNSWWNDE